MNVLITGAAGFIGKALVNAFLEEGHCVFGVVRAQCSKLPSSVEQIVIEDLSCLVEHFGEDGQQTNQPINASSLSPINQEYFRSLLEFDKQAVGQLLSVLRQTDVIVHTAAIAHNMKMPSGDMTDRLELVNVATTQILASLAAKVGVKRFVFLSSIGVNGAFTTGTPFTEGDMPNPHNIYASSKWRAEQAVSMVAATTDLETVIIRPPLVYGANAPGNFKTLLKAVTKGVPLPLGSTKNHRSFIALDNLVDFISLCSNQRRSPSAANQTFLISDDEYISTAQLIKRMAAAFGVKLRLFRVPIKWLVWMLALMSKKELCNSLLADLQIDCTKAKSQLDWHPVCTMGEQLRKIAEATK